MENIIPIIAKFLFLDFKPSIPNITPIIAMNGVPINEIASNGVPIIVIVIMLTMPNINEAIAFPLGSDLICCLV